MTDKEIWRQERPSWCPHADCVFVRRVTDTMCGGQLPNPEAHDGDFNTHRFCLNGVIDDGEVFDLQINRTDAGWFLWLFNAMFSELTYLGEKSEVTHER